MSYRLLGDCEKKTRKLMLYLKFSTQKLHRKIMKFYLEIFIHFFINSPLPNLNFVLILFFKL